MAFERALEEVEILRVESLSLDPALRQQQDARGNQILATLPLPQATGHASPDEARMLKADLFLLSENPALRYLAMKIMGAVEADEEAAEEGDEETLQTLREVAEKLNASPTTCNLVQANREIAAPKQIKIADRVDNLLLAAEHDPVPALRSFALSAAGAVIRQRQQVTAEQASRIATLSEKAPRASLRARAEKILTAVAGFMPVRHSDAPHIVPPQDVLA